MIDLHCHILPGVDDGADSMNTALAMARDAWESGIRALVATPHCNKPGCRSNFYTPELGQQFVRLQRAVRQSGMGLKIYPGMEIFVTRDFPRQLQEGKYLALGASQYLLVEFYFDESPEFMADALSAIREYGLKPVVAHPERYFCVQWEPEMAMRWADAGVVLQLNRGSIQGKLGQASMKCAWELLNAEKAHVVASDAHGSVSRRAELKSVLMDLGERLSWSYAARLLMENPRKILCNEPVDTDWRLPLTFGNGSDEI